MRRWSDGVAHPIDGAALAGWQRLTGVVLCREDVAVLRKMDIAFRDAVSQERAEDAARVAKKGE